MTKYIDMFRGAAVLFTRFDGKQFTALITTAEGPLDDGQPPSFANLFVLESPLGFAECVPYDAHGFPGSFQFIGEPAAARWRPELNARDVTLDAEMDKLGEQLRVKESAQRMKEQLDKSRIAAAEEQELANRLDNKRIDEPKKNLDIDNKAGIAKGPAEAAADGQAKEVSKLPA